MKRNQGHQFSDRKDFLEGNSATTHIDGEQGGELHAKRYTGPPGHREWGIQENTWRSEKNGSRDTERRCWGFVDGKQDHGK